MSKTTKRPAKPAMATLYAPGFRFENGHTVGSSGIPHPTKFTNRARKAANRVANLSQRAAIQSGGKTWHGAIMGTPAAANVATKGRK